MLFYPDNTLNCSACGIHWFIQSMQLYHPRFSMYTLAPHWYSDRMTQGHFLPVYSRIPGPVTLYTQSIQTQLSILSTTIPLDQTKKFILVLFGTINQVCFLCQMLLQNKPQDSVTMRCPVKHGRKGSEGSCAGGKLQRVLGVNWELPDFVKEDLRRVYGTYPSR